MALLNSFACPSCARSALAAKSAQTRTKSAPVKTLLVAPVLFCDSQRPWLTDVLNLRCPFCGTTRSDDWECLPAGKLDFLRCENPRCLMSFCFLIHECAACAEESVFIWKEKPQRQVLASLVCQHCAEGLSDASDPAETESPPQRI